MFNFLFDGKLGDILAPVVPTNQLFLAIQHQRNGEIVGLIATAGYDPNHLPDCGYAAVHVACRYNNRYALDYLLSLGTSINFLDKQGDTPLHYAAKYGNLDLCKYLVEKGAVAHTQNKHRQSPYDVSQSHLVRQYLLPLVLQSERSHGVAQVDYTGYGGIHAPPLTQQPPPPALAPPSALAPPLPMQYNNVPPPSHSMPPMPPTQPTVFSPPPTLPPSTLLPRPPSAPSDPPSSTLQANPYPAPYVGPTGGRVILPDGFHSSASDPVLQQKYGHIIEKPAIAPPPTAIPAPYSAPYASSSSTVYQRYVPYDPHSHSPAPPPLPVPAPAHPTPVPTNAPPLTSRLLGRVSVGNVREGLEGVQVFNPHTDTTVVITNSSSSVL